jgi:MarR family transcriptional regulator, 2-MHQ and catechol-resistance regulon repressor
MLSDPYSPPSDRDLYVSTVRELVRAYQMFSSYSEAHVRKFGLTPAQFDVIATLGNTSGMSMGELGEKTLITKGTLTGVIDRLEHKKLVQRQTPPDNRRCVIVQLTAPGETLFQQVFPAHLAHIRARMTQLEPSELELLGVLLARLRQALAETYGEMS